MLGDPNISNYSRKPTLAFQTYYINTTTMNKRLVCLHTPQFVKMKLQDRHLQDEQTSRNEFIHVHSIPLLGTQSHSLGPDKRTVCPFVRTVFHRVEHIGATNGREERKAPRRPVKKAIGDREDEGPCASQYVTSPCMGDNRKSMLVSHDPGLLCLLVKPWHFYFCLHQ